MFSATRSSGKPLGREDSVGIDPLVLKLFTKYGAAQYECSEISAHLCHLHVLAREFCGVGLVVECGVGDFGFSTMALLSGVVKSGGRMASYDINPNACAGALATMGMTDVEARNKGWSFWTRDSTVAAGDWSDNSVGMFFLDTDHTRETTRRELAAWLPKIHPEGIICGHDYYPDPKWPTTEVNVAVDEFVRQYQERFRLQVLPHDHGLFILWPKRLYPA